jgi:hypothetical protein
MVTWNGKNQYYSFNGAALTNLSLNINAPTGAPASTSPVTWLAITNNGVLYYIPACQ